MALESGRRFGLYEIAGEIGAGGMGVVYRARDTKLDREVAIKVLPRSMAEDADRLARFDREAKTLASLNHPNIGQIYGLEESEGMTALVLELVEGPTLAERIEEGPLPVAESLNVAMQIASALEAAHGQGIVHRDLKPANIKLRPDGAVKVLDFGIAKALDVRQTSDLEPRILSTPTMTQAGIVLGTAQYMSPEQARGKPVDRRADIWAFGCVLYEMLTGQPAFGGEDVTVILARILERDADLGSLPADISPAVRHTLTLCLRKDPGRRVRDIGDVKLALEGEFEADRPSATFGQSGWRQFLPVSVAAAVTALVVGFIAWSLWPAPEPRPVTRFNFALPDGLVPRASGRPVIAVSPDGSSIVVNSVEGIFLRTLDDLEPRVISGTEGAGTAVMLSPDGRFIAYFWPAAQQLLRVSVQGGESIVLAEGVSNPFGATWGTDDTILFSQPTGIFRVPASGGTPELLIEMTEEEAYGPQLLPDGDSVLYSVTPTPASAGFRDWDHSQIVVHSLSKGERTVLLEGGSDARYLPTGHLVFALGDRLLGVAFDPNTATVSGSPVPLIQDLLRATSNQTGVAHYSVSANGTLAYIRSSLRMYSRGLVWVHRSSGIEETIAIEPSSYAYPRISPDGLRIALDDRNPGEHIWVLDLRSETLTRLTVDEQSGFYPVWTPDSSRIAYGVVDPGPEIYWRPANNVAPAAPFATDVHKPSSGEDSPRTYFFTPSTGRIVFSSWTNETRDDIGIVDADGSGPTWLLEGPYNEFNAELSPDGRWMAYQSDESGRSEVYVRPFPDVSDYRIQISNAGGFKPLWSRDGRELFYLEGESPSSLMSVAIESSESGFAFSERTRIMEWPYELPYDGRTYDVSPDGQRFLAIKDNPGAVDNWIVVVQNWFEELKIRVPTE